MAISGLSGITSTDLRPDKGTGEGGVSKANNLKLFSFPGTSELKQFTSSFIGLIVSAGFAISLTASVSLPLSHLISDCVSAFLPI